MGRFHDRLARGLCGVCGSRPPREGRTSCQECKDRSEQYSKNPVGRARQKRTLTKLRREVIAGYGGRCTCCGETEELFLELDHMNGGGSKERRLSGSGGSNISSETFQRRLRDQGFPKEFQVLCANCNRGKWRNGGVCPHQSSSDPR